MNGLSCGEESMTIYLAVLIQYQRVTDGRITDDHADGQTDVQPISITCFSIADARKKVYKLQVVSSRFMLCCCVMHDNTEIIMDSLGPYNMLLLVFPGIRFNDQVYKKLSL